MNIGYTFTCKTKPKYKPKYLTSGNLICTKIQD